MKLAANIYPDPADPVATAELMDVTALDRVAAGNCLAAGVLARGLQEWEGLPEAERGDKPSLCVSYNWSAHRWFPMLAIKSTAKGNSSKPR